MSRTKLGVQTMEEHSKMKKDSSIPGMYKRLALYLRPYWYFGIFILLLTLSCSLTGPLVADVTRGIVTAIELENMRLLLLYGFLSIVSLVVTMFLQSLKNYVTTLLAAKGSLTLESHLFEHITSLPMEFFHRSHSGDIIARVTNDVGAVRNVIQGQLSSLVQIPLDAIVVVIYGVSINWQITLMVLLAAPLPLILNLLFGKKLQKTAQDAHEVWSEIYSLSNDMLRGIDVIKAYSLYEQLLSKLQEYYEADLDVGLTRIRLSMVIAIGSNLVASLFLVVPSVIGAQLILNGTLSFADVVAIVTVIPRVAQPFYVLPRVISDLQQGTAAAQRVLNVMDLQPERYGTGKLPENYEVELKDVSFSYGGAVKVLDSVNMVIKKRNNVAIVGPSGCGKSTLLKVIMGFYKPNKGDIEISQRSLFSYDLSELRNLMSYVPQEPYLFAGTIKDNILVGKPNADEEEWHRAAEISLVDEFVKELPFGYDTYVSQNGMNLSGGQRQRIGIARALLKGAPILLLDECTSSLDLITERRLCQGLERYRKIETIVVVTHRLSTVQNADIIYVLDNGRVVEQGTHEQLLADKELYFRLYISRSGGEAFDNEVASVF